MKCDEVVQNLEAYDAEELSEGEQTRVAEHLAACSDCERERREVLALAAELRSAGDSFRALRPFTVPAPAPPVRRPQPWLAALGAAAAVWLILLTAVAFWPSFAERLSFLPIGQRLAETSRSGEVPSQAAPTSPDGSYSLADVPGEALAAVDAVFQPSEGRLLSKHVVSVELSRLLPVDLARAASVSVVSLGPVRSVVEGEVRIVVTVDISRDEGQSGGASQRHQFLLTVTREAHAEWQVSDLQRLVD